MPTPAWLLDVRRANGDARAEVEALFLRALATLDALPDRETRVSTSRPYGRCVRVTHGSATRPRRTTTSTMRGSCRRPPISIACCDVLAWGAALDRVQWIIVRDRADGFSDAAIADRAHMPIAAVRR